MASIKEIRTRIVSVDSTKKITSAMKMVSAAKLRKAQTAVTQMRPYADKLDDLLSNLSSGMDDGGDSVYTRNSEIKKVLIISIASNGGLCGAFNSNVVKESVALVNRKYASQNEQGNVDFLVLGKKPGELLEGRGIKPTETNIEILDNATYETVSAKATEVMKAFASGEYDKVELVYNVFKNAATQVVVAKEFLPVTPTESEDTVAKDYIFEPSKEFIIQEIIPKSLRIQFYNAVLESIASEHGARMTSMHKATDNAGELLASLKLEYNKARQAAITTEISEITSGANALGK